MSGGMLSAEYMNPIIDELRAWAIERREWLLEEFYASGHPPGTEPSNPAQVYQTLVALMQSGSRDYWDDPQAQEDLQKLEETFGPAPPLRPPAQGGM